MRNLSSILSLSSFFIFLHAYSSYTAVPYQRCRAVDLQARNSSSPLHSFRQSSCKSCRATKLEETHVNDKNISVGVFLNYQQPSLPQAITLTAGLLSQGYSVTAVLAGSDIPETWQKEITQQIYNLVPCSAEEFLYQRLSIHFLKAPQSCGSDNSVGDLIHCYSLNAVPLFYMFHSIQSLETLDLIITDATFVPGLFWAERTLTPAFVLFEQDCSSTLLSRVLGVWPGDPPTIVDFVKKRMFHFQWLARIFVSVNRARQSLGFPHVRTLSEIWKGTSLWVSPEVQTVPPRPHDVSWNTWDDPHVLLYPSPLWPHCVPCLGESTEMGISFKESTANANSPVIVLTGSMESPSTVRTLMQGLANARSSIHAFTSSCEHDLPCSSWNGPSDFRVILTRTMPGSLRPSFVLVENQASLVDLFARYNQVLAVIQVGQILDSQYIVPASVPLIEFDESTGARQLAHTLIGTLGKQSPSFDDQPDGLSWMLGVASKVSTVKRQRGSTWSDHTQVASDVLDALYAPSEMYEPAIKTNHFLRIAAIVILVMVGFYFQAKEFFPLHHLRHRRSVPRGNSTISLGAVTDEVLSRLPELDLALEILQRWTHQRFAAIDEIHFLSHAPPPSTTHAVPHGPKHKKKPPKKRH